VLRLTPAATSFIAQYRRELGFDEWLAPRLTDRDGKVSLTFVTRPQPDDVVVADAPVPVYVARDVAGRLDRATLDARRDGDATILVIREPWPPVVPGGSWLH
jgi:hypothetical protein